MCIKLTGINSSSETKKSLKLKIASMKIQTYFTFLLMPLVLSKWSGFYSNYFRIKNKKTAYNWAQDKNTFFSQENNIKDLN